MLRISKSKNIRLTILVHESTTEISKLNLNLLCIYKYITSYFYCPKIDTQSSFLFFSFTVACYYNQIISLDRVSVVYNIG